MEGEYEVMDATDRDPAAFLSGLPSQILSESLAGSALLEHGYHNHHNGLPVLSTMQVEQDHHFGPQFNGQSSNLMSHGSRIRLGLAFDGGGLSANDASGSSGKFSDVGLHESVTFGSLANIMGNQSNLPLSDQEISLEMMGVLLSRGCSNPSNDDMNSSKSWDSTATTNYLIQPEDFSWRTSVPGFDQQIQFGDDICLDEWTAPPMASDLCSDHHQAYDSSARLNSELSLSLATCGPTAVCGTTNIQGQCSDMSCCSVSHHSQFESGLNSDQNCPHSNSREQLSLSFPNSAGNSTTQVILGSRYLHVIEQILSEIASYSLESVSLLSYPNNVGSRSKHPGDGVHEVAPVEPPRQRKEIEAKKSQLLALLQMVDDQYNQCVDEIHTVTSAFHAATELDPQTHVRFSLQTISSLYKNLRERISTQILRLGSQEVDNGSSTSTGAIISDQRSSLEKSFIQRQWTIQQLKKREQQLWRPQRGLPERSVSVLRAWMFQNFLHPYPKDAEKHLLAIKSGLTRSQVSNWFINARVRLWKPLIEEMDAEVNRRNKVRTNKEGTDNSRRNQTTVYYPRFEMNDNL